jgi:hypothetical protein
MRCEVVRLRLLSAENPAKAPADLRAHLARCEFCRDWHEDLCALEQHVPYLPVPNSRGKAKLLQRLLSEKSEPQRNGHPAATKTDQTLAESSTVTAADSPILPHPRFFTFPGLMAGLAAVVVFLLGTLRLRN